MARIRDVSRGCSAGRGAAALPMGRLMAGLFYGTGEIVPECAPASVERITAVLSDSGMSSGLGCCFSRPPPCCSRFCCGRS